MRGHLQIDRSPRTSRIDGAFTLVELLVVIGVIAVLMAVLLPTLAKAQQAAQRTACLSNLRQIHQAFAFYALDNRDQVPLGYRAGTPIGAGNGVKQFNSMIYSATSKRYVLFGWLYAGGYMKTPRVFFCPSESNPQSMFNSDVNPWPPGPDGNPAIQGWAGYACRPEVELPDDPAAFADPKIVMPKLNEFRNKAIFADLTALPARVDTRHRSGINVLFGNGAAHWVERSRFDADLAACTAIKNTFNPQQDAIWAALDR
jgi:prepilin-type N-terminal cleavage/methylation domain-containing protein